MDGRPRTDLINRARRRTRRAMTPGSRLGLLLVALFAILLPRPALSQDFTATSLGDYGNVTVMEVQGNYDADNPDGTVNAVPRQVIANEFYKTHKDDYDFLVIFTNFDFKMPAEEPQAEGFYEGVKNDVSGIGVDRFDYSQSYGSGTPQRSGKLQGTIDMGNLASKVTDPLDPNFEDTLYVLAHELMHRWAAHATFKDANGNISSALIGHLGSHWSFLLDSGGSVMYGNQWRDNGDGTFTTTTPQSQMKVYSPLDLYLMGMLDKSKVPPMLLITSPDTDTSQLPQTGITVTGTAQYVTIDQIIAAMGPRVPDATTSQKSFKSAFIFITQPGTFRGDEIYGIENVRNGALTRFSILTDGKAILQVAPTLQDNVASNPGVLPPNVTPRTLPPDINDGVAWLQANQKPDGSWMDQPDTLGRDTAESAQVLRNFITASTNFQSGIQWLASNDVDNTDYAARKMETLAGAGQDTSALLTALGASQNSDGGWGSGEAYLSNPVDTALSLKAMAAKGLAAQSTSVANSIGYLKSKQNADGGWGVDDGASTVQATANVLSAFNAYRQNLSLEDRIQAGTAFLLSKQNTDGGFGNSPSTIYDTAQAVLALQALGQTSANANALSYLLSQQGGDGSWNESAYQTALAVDAVYQSNVEPDLSVTGDDITFIPASITTLPTNVVINASISNLGRTEVPQATVVLYEGDPVSGRKIGEQTVAFPGQQATTVTFSATITDGNEHPYTVVVDPDNLVKESNKQNNSAANVLTPQATYDFEVLPQNIALSANPVDMLQDVQITAQITNKGTMNAYNVQVRYFVDDPASPVEIATQTVDIPAGATITNQATWRASRAGVDLPVTVQVDPFDTFTELSETNNKASTPITVNGTTAPNLSASYKDLSISPAPLNQGGSAAISLLVRNDGTAAASNVKVNFYEGVPGMDGVLLGSQVLPVVNPGDAVPASFSWTNIPDTGEKIIYAAVDPDNQVQELREDDNDAFTTVNILSLPDLAVGTKSIVFSPAAPKDGDPVTITVNVQNLGDQTASSVVVSLSEDGVVLGTQTIPAIAGGSTGTVSLAYDTTGKKGVHTITAVVDPDNTIAELTEDNNRAANTFGVQDSNLWVTEQYFSPNGDGVKDATQLFFGLETPRTVSLNVSNGKSETVRTFSGPELTDTTGGNVVWDGLNNDGAVVSDGPYTISVDNAKSGSLGTLLVTVDTNRSPLADAFGTKYLLNNDLTCMLPDLSQSEWTWFPDESGILVSVLSNASTPDYPTGLYTVSPDGQDIQRIVPADWNDTLASDCRQRTAGNFCEGYTYPAFGLSADGDAVAFILKRAAYTGSPYSYWWSWVPDLQQLWVTDRYGKNLVLLASYDAASQTSIYDILWSPAGNALVYRVDTGTAEELWLVNRDGTGKKLLDSGGYFDANFIRWSPDGAQLAYVFGNYDANGYHERIRTVDLEGNKREVFTVCDPTDPNTRLNYTDRLEWLSDQKLLQTDNNGDLWLLDASGNGNHVQVSEQPDTRSIVIAPNRKSFVFTETSYSGATSSSSITMKMCDTGGNVVTLHTTEDKGECCWAIESLPQWSLDSKQIAFSESVESNECYENCANLVAPQTAVVDVVTNNEVIYKNELQPVAWLSDGVSVAGTLSQNSYPYDQSFCVLNAQNGDTRCVPMGSAVTLPSDGGHIVSPHERYFSYYENVNSSSVCYGRAYQNLWAMSSLLNLTADLRMSLTKSAVVLKGIAADLNFDSYRIEYAEASSPTTWNPIGLPSYVPVVNDVFTTWVPPHEGTFYVRLTVRDKAGNTAVDMKRVPWGLMSSITNIFKTLDVISPNGDGVQDDVELHYTVLEPVHLEFRVYDESGDLVRTYSKDHPAPTSDFITWDGKDGSGNVVPDGKYSIKVFDYEFFVTVDDTPPQVAAVLGHIYKNAKTAFLSADLTGYVIDKNLKTWTIEYGYGDNPQEWHVYKQGNAELAVRDSYGNPVVPAQATTLNTYQEQALVPLIGAKLRLTAEDYAGNRSTAITDMLEETVFLDRYVKDKLGNIGFLSAEELQTATDALTAPGTQQLGGLSTVRTPIVSRNVQYGIIDKATGIVQWFNSPVEMTGPAEGFYWTPWTNTGIKIDALRIKEVDELGKEHYSNSLLLGYPLRLDPCTLEVTDNLFEDLAWLAMYIQSNDDPNYARPTVYAFTTTPLKRLPMQFDLPKNLLSGKHYTIFAEAQPVNAFRVDSLTVQYPVTCRVDLSLALDVNYREGDCGLSPGTADVIPTLKKEGLSNIFLKTLSYYVKKTTGSELLYQVDLTRQPFAGIQIDTNTYAEGSYPVTATLAYNNELGEAQPDLTASASMIVDRVTPTSMITYPSGTSLVLCPSPQHGVGGDWFGIPVEGMAADNTAVNRFELYYGVGDNPDVWHPATDRTRVSAQNLNGWITGKGAINGRIGTWDVSALPGGRYTLKLRVIDIAGNATCSFATFSFDSAVNVVVSSLSSKVFSPNGDGTLDTVAAYYSIDKYAMVDARVYNALSSPSGYVLDTSSVKTIATNIQYLGGTGSVAWDGKNDGGAVVPDGLYGIAILAKDACGNTAQKWGLVEVDDSPPTVSIAYPQPGDALGNIVEVSGSATDPHFQNFTLDAGEGVSPTAWSRIATSPVPVSKGMLGKWNAFGLQGTWTLRLTASDSVGNTATTSSTIDLGERQNLVKDLSVSPRFLSPNDDGVSDTTTVQYELTDACQVTLDLVDATGAVKRTTATSVPSAGTYAVIWDGKDGNGAVVTEGTYSVRLTAVLTANPAVTERETSVAVVDTTPPAIDISQPLTGSYIKTDVTVTGSLTDANLSSYSLTNSGNGTSAALDSGNQNRSNYVFGTLSGLVDGNYTLQVSASDLAGNSATKDIAYTIDRTPPAVKLDAPKDGEYYSTSKEGIAVSGSIVEKNIDSCALRYGSGEAPSQWNDLVTGTTVTACSLENAWNAPEGVYTVSLFAKDKAVLTGEARVKVTVDNTPPTVAITSLHDGDYVKQALDITGTAFDRNLDKYTLDISGGQCASAFQWVTIKTGTASVQDDVLGTWKALPPDGDCCVRLTALDKVGQTAEAKVDVIVDTHPPAAPVLSGAVDSKVNASLTWTANTEPDLAGYNLYRTGQKVNTALITDSRYLDQNLTEGSYPYTVKAQDLAGWESQPSNTVTVKIDTTAPEASIRVPQDGARVSGLIDIKGTAYSNDDFKQYLVSVGEGTAPSSWTVIRTSPVPITYGVLAQWNTFGLAEGEAYSIRLEAEDLSGNVSSSQVTVTVDNTPPAKPTIISAPTNSADVTVTWNANTETDLAGYLLYRNDQLANVNGIAVGDLKPYLIQGTSYLDAGLPDGTFRYYLIAVDQAGNESVPSDERQVTIDTHPPHAVITQPADGASFEQKLLVEAESPDEDVASVQFEYKLATASTWTALGAPVTSQPFATYLDAQGLGLAHGDYQLTAVATDQGGRTDPSPSAITVTYTDLTPPDAPQGLSAHTNGNTVSLAWTANAESDLAGYNVYRTSGGTRAKMNASLIPASLQPVYQDTGVADGDYVYDVTATDTHNNESKPSDQAPARVYAPVISQPYTPVGQSVVAAKVTGVTADAGVSLFADTPSGLVSLGTATADGAGDATLSAMLSPGENRLVARATDGAGNVSRDSVPVVVVYDIAPSAPTGVAAALNGSDVHLTWNPSPEPSVLGYNVYRDGAKLNASVPLDLLQGTTSASSMLDWYLTPPGMAVDSASYSYWSPESGTSAENPSWWEIDLPSPQLIRHVDIHWGTDVDSAGNQVLYAGKDYELQVWSGYAWITQTKVTDNAAKDNSFDFNPSYATDRIRIFITDSTDVNSAKEVRLVEVNMSGDNLIVPASGQPAYDDTGLPNKDYQYTVTAVDNYAFESLPSDTASAAVAVAPPDQPASLSVAPGTDGTMSATWVYTGSPAAGYNLYRGLTSGGPYVKVNDGLIGQTSYLDSGLVNGVTYFYVVTAVDLAGNEGAYSNEASGTAQDLSVPVKPTIFYPTLPGLPITRSKAMTDISGRAEPGATVELRPDGVAVGTSTAERDDSISSGSVAYDGNAAAISPDGKTLAYTSNGYVWLRSVADGATTRAFAVYSAYTLAWSPDSSKIALDYTDSNWTGYIGIYDVATGGFTTVSGEAGADYYEPSWSSDGNKLLYGQWGGNAPGIWSLDMTTGQSSRIIEAQEPDCPALSPDGSNLAYLDGGSLFVMNMAGGAPQLVADNTDWYTVQWSPDGSRLAFVSYRNGDGDIYVLDMTSGNQVPVPGSSSSSYGDIVWSPDGNSLLFDLYDWTNSSDTLWMTDLREGGTASRIMPNLNNVAYLGAAKSGLVAFLSPNPDGSFAYYLLTPKGTFSFSDVPLKPGENIFTAATTDAAGNVKDSSDPISVTRDMRSTPDLAVTADDIYLYPAYPLAGDQMAINAVVSNTSQVDVSNVNVLVYVWNANGQLELLASPTIAAIPAESSTVVTASWDSTGKTGANRLVVVVDPDDTIAESNESNNMAIKDFYVADHVGFSLSAATDLSLYHGNQDVHIDVTTWNTGPAAQAVLAVGIEDALGNPVATFDPSSISVAYAASSVQSYSWNTGSTFAGPYVVHAVLKDLSGNVLAETTTAFDIASDAKVGLTVTTDRAAYGPQQNVETGCTIRNTGTNAVIPAVQAAFSIADASGTVLFSQSKTVSDLLPGAAADLTSLWNTGWSAPGQYTATVEASIDGLVVAAKSVQFAIQGTAALTGSIDVTPSVVPYGSSAQVSYAVANTGNLDAQGNTIRVSIVDPDTQTVMDSQDRTADIAANASVNGQITISTSGYGLKTYDALLQVLSQGTGKTIGSSSFAVKDLTPPIVKVLSPSTNGMYGAEVLFSASASDNASGVSRVEYQLDDGAWLLLPVVDPSRARYGTTWRSASNDQGSHTVGFRATDNAGNTSVTQTVPFTVQTDTVPPVTTITVGTPKYGSGNTLFITSATVLTLSATDNSSGVARTEYLVDGGTWTDYLPFTVAGEGEHKIHYRSSDNAGNIETAKELGVTVDNTPPVTTLTAFPALAQGVVSAVSPTTRFSLSATDNLSGVSATEYRIDGGSWRTYTGSFSLGDLPAGPHVIGYRSTDNVQNQETDRTVNIRLLLIDVTKKVETSLHVLVAAWRQGDADGCGQGEEKGKGLSRSPGSGTHSDGNAGGSGNGLNNVQGRNAALDRLEAILSAAGIAYSIPADADDFEMSFRSGRYNTYIVLDDAGGVDQKVRSELRESVNYGDGIVSLTTLPSAPDSADPSQAGIFGVALRGVTTDSDLAVQLLNSPVANAGVLEAIGKGLVTTVTASTAQVFGTMKDKHAIRPAIVFNQYGRGRAMLYAFDLLACPDKARSAALLLSSLDYVRPLEHRFRALDSAPISIRLSNSAEPADVKIVETLPKSTTADTITPKGTEQDGTITWLKSLGPDETARFGYYLNLPDVAGQYTAVTGLSYLSGDGYLPYGEYPLTLRIENSSADLLRSVIAEAVKMAVSGPRKKGSVEAVIEALSSVRAYATERAEIEENIDRIVRAEEKVAELSADTTQLRLELDELLKIWEKKWYLASTHGSGDEHDGRDE